MDEPQRLVDVMSRGKPSPTVEGKYLHWDQLRHHPPPEGLTHEEWWIRIKFARQALASQLPLKDEAGRPFVLASPDLLHRQLHEADRDLSGRMKLPSQLTTDGIRDRFQMSTLIEEAITSSQLEGAATTRKVANEMLRSGRQPHTHDEVMIFNNFQAMEYVRSVRNEPLSPDLVLRIHSIVTDGTLEDPSACGRLRTVEESRGAFGVYAPENTLLHTPPAAQQLPERLNACCEFANEDSGPEFIHPIARSILLHFWIGHDHPFVDGNGRTARALFYWSMLHHEYWLAEFVSVSHILYRAPAQYTRSYLHAETDDNDATYFVLHQMSVLLRSIKALLDYVRRKTLEVRKAQELMKHSSLNHRQVALLGHAIRNPDAEYTASRHASSHRVTRQTARTDLKELSGLGLLEERVRGRTFVFSVPHDLEARFQVIGQPSEPTAGGRGPGRPPRPFRQRSLLDG